MSAMLWAWALFGLRRDIQANTKNDNKIIGSEVKKAYREGLFVMGRRASILSIVV
jgi:hypothetical protein